MTAGGLPNAGYFPSTVSPKVQQTFQVLVKGGR